MKSAFIHLNVHTNYSLLSGACRIKDLLRRAVELGADALAITDTNGLYGAIPFLTKAREFGIKPILGAEIVCGAGTAVCIASDREGYANLCRVITARHLSAKFSLADALERYQEGLFILTHDAPLLHRLAGRIRGGRLFREIQYFADSDEEGFAGVPPVATNNVHFVTPGGREIHRVLTAIRKNKLLSEVGPDEVAPPDAWLKSADEMACLFSGSAVGREAIANTRRIADACNLELKMGSPIFPKFFSLKDIPPELAGETPHAALRKLAFRGMHSRYRPPSPPFDNSQGGPERWPNGPEVVKRLEYELDVIERLHFSEYFLIVWDIASFALRKNIPIVGRGSAGNSLVAYCLGITSVDPLAHELYFERFLNLSRRDCPDIDLDLCWRRRDEVIRYVYERHGAERVAMVSNHNTYQARSAFRDVARVFGLPIEEINRLSSVLPHYSSETIRAAKELFPEARDFPLDREPYRTIVALAEALDGFPRHLGIHNGGIVIGDRPLTDYLPLELATKGIVVTQYEMNAVEAVGLVKIDLLGHRSLTVISDTIEAVRKNRGVGQPNLAKVCTNLRKVPPEADVIRIGSAVEEIPDGDRQTAALLRAGRTIGCFQIESPGMRSLLQMIRAENRLDVIHALSLIRPGPSGSGMKEHFVRRRLGEESPEYLDPRLEKVLGDTYGVMLFQEDILKVAAVIAGFTLEEGDALRQAISKKRSPERIAALRERFMRGAAGRGVRRNAAEEIWKLIENFAGYSYCKAHAVTYGYISYQAAYLKAHYPAEFLCAVMANQGGFYETREYLEEARRFGVRILPPDVNFSGANHSVEEGHRQDARIYRIGPSSSSLSCNPVKSVPGGIRIGLAQVKGLSQRALNSILRARAKRRFSSLEDFYFRTQVNNSETEKLILCGALGNLGRFDHAHGRPEQRRMGGGTRPQLLWELRLLSKEISRSFAGPLEEGLFGSAGCVAHPPPGLSLSNGSGVQFPADSSSPAEAAELRRAGATGPHSAIPSRLFSARRSGGAAKSGGGWATSPALPEYPLEERIRLEQEILNLSVSDHPLRMFSRELAERDLSTSDQLAGKVGRSVTVAGWLVTLRRAVTKNREYMQFLTLEDRFGTMEVILFPRTYRRFGHLIRSYGPYLVRGRVEQNHRSIGITAEWLDTLN